MPIPSIADHGIYSKEMYASTYVETSCEFLVKMDEEEKQAQIAAKGKLYYGQTVSHMLEPAFFLGLFVAIFTGPLGGLTGAAFGAWMGYGQGAKEDEFIKVNGDPDICKRRLALKIDQIQNRLAEIVDKISQVASENLTSQLTVEKSQLEKVEKSFEHTLYRYKLHKPNYDHYHRIGAYSRTNRIPENDGSDLA